MNTPKIKLEIEVTPEKAFDILLQSLHVTLDEEIDISSFIVNEDAEIILKDFDDRGELYLALYHLATKIFPNTEFRGAFDDPNELMSKLYIEKAEKEE